MALIALVTDFWIVRGSVVDAGAARQAAVHVQDGRIVELATAAPDGAQTMEAGGLFLTPAVVDAHVHLSVAGDLEKVAKAELSAGVAGVLDLGEPEKLLPALGGLAPLRVKFAGPLLTAPKGYPTQSWGKDGYGGELATADDAKAAVDRLAASGASMIKLAFDGRFALLEPAVAKAAVAAAHAKGLRVACHALQIAMVRRALDAGCDVLAHTPAEALPDELVKEIGAHKLVVVSTLKAVGGSAAAVANLRALKEAGARVVYGTDLGNQDTAPGIDAGELALLATAGLTAAEIVHAATSEAASFAGFTDLGSLAPGKAASLLALPTNPLLDAAALAKPTWVLIDGMRQ